VYNYFVVKLDETLVHDHGFDDKSFKKESWMPRLCDLASRDAVVHDTIQLL
jgi:hypothetical protein